MIEKVFLGFKRYSRFFDYDIYTVDNCMKMFPTGFTYPLMDRDEEGRRIILTRYHNWNPELFSTYDAMRLFCYVTVVLLEEEETQIAGLVHIFDFKGYTLKQMFTPGDLMEAADLIKNITAARLKKTYIVNLPSFATTLIEIGKTFLSEKLRDRITILRTSDDINNHINMSLLPKEYGGQKTEEEMLQNFLNLKEQVDDNVAKIYDFRPDWSKVSYEKIWSRPEHENVGSFRKLEID